MKTLEWFEKLWKGTGRSNQYVMLPPEQTRLRNGRQSESTELKAGEHYFRLLLVEMFLANDRKWLTDWFPVVHTALSFKFGDQQELLTNVAGESFLHRLGQQKPGRVVGLNYPLTPLLPFNGGTIELTSGLVSVAGGNDVLACLEILGSFSQLLLVPQLSAALAVATPLADGVAKFVGATQNQMLLALHQTWSGAPGGANVLRSGYFAVIAADERTVDPRNLFVVDDNLRRGQTIGDAEPVTGYNYMLFRLECLDERDDWDSLTAIQKPYERAVEMLEAGNVEQAEAFIRTAKAAAFTAKELTSKVDRRRVIERLENAYRDAKDLLGGQRAFETAGAPRLSNLMQHAVVPAKAKKGILLAETFGLQGLVNHSSKSSKPFVPLLKDDLFAGWEAVQAGDEKPTATGGEPRESFFFELDGKQVSGNTVKKGSKVDLVFDYGAPQKDSLVIIEKAEDLENARRSDAAIGILVSPRGFVFVDKKESGYRQIEIKNGAFVQGAVRFHLKAFDSKSYKKAFSGPEKGAEEASSAEKSESVIYSTGFHIAFDIKGVQIYRFFLPVKLADKISGNDKLEQPLSFDLDKLNESSRHVTKARSDLSDVVGKILAGKEAW